MFLIVVILKPQFVDRLSLESSHQKMNISFEKIEGSPQCCPTSTLALQQLQRGRSNWCQGTVQGRYFLPGIPV